MTGNLVEYRLWPAAAAGPVKVEARDPVLPLWGSLAAVMLEPAPAEAAAAAARASFMAARRVRIKTRVVTGGHAPAPLWVAAPVDAPDDTAIPLADVVSPKTIKSPVPPLERSLTHPPGPRLLDPLPTLPVDEVRHVATRAGLSTVVVLAGVLGSRLRSHPCRSASSGVIRVSGSQSKQREIKSTKSVSSSDHSVFVLLFMLLLLLLLAVPELPLDP